MRKFLLLIALYCVHITTGMAATRQVVPAITSFTPSSGAVGTLVTITGTDLSGPTAFSIGGVTAIVVSDSGTSLVGLVMPGAITGAIALTTSGGSVTSTGTFTVTPTHVPDTQQGGKLTDLAYTGLVLQGCSVALSADGNTAIIGGSGLGGYYGAAWVYVRSGGAWTRQGGIITPNDNIGAEQFGVSVSLSADGNTALVGGLYDNGIVGAVWVFVRSGGVWTQQGNKLVGSDHNGLGYLGISVSLSADGNTAAMGAHRDNNYNGAVWVFTRSGTTWTQQGSKLTPNDNTGAAQFGYAVALSADAKTMVIGGNSDNGHKGAAWIFTKSGTTWTQYGSKFVESDVAGNLDFGCSAAINADGTTIMVGEYVGNNSPGAAWVFTLNGGTWTQQGNALTGTGNVGNSGQGPSVALTADGNTAMVGGPRDNGDIGAAWQYTRTGGVWTQKGNKLVGTGNTGGSNQGTVALSADGATAFVGGANDNGNSGAAWAYYYVPPPVINSTGTLTALTANYGSVSTNGTFNVSGTDIIGGILVTAPTNFEVSLNTTSGFANSITVGSTGNITATPVYIRLKAGIPVNSYSGNVVLTSSGATTVNVATVSSTVTAVPLVITADAQNKIYGQANPALTLSYSTFVNGDTPASLLTPATATTVATINSPVNSYPIIPAGATSNNYTITYVNGALAIGQASLTITATGPVKPFGAALTAGTSTTNFTTSSTQNSEVINSVTLTPDAAGLSATTPAGASYIVTPSAVTGTNGFLAGNYNISYVNFNGIVGATSQTINFNPLPATVTYGDAPLDLLAVNASSGLPVSFTSSDTHVATFNGSTLTIVGAGTTIITASQTGNGNYNPAPPVMQTLTVNAKTLTITPGNISKIYGQTLTGVTSSTAFTAVGLQNSETIGSITIGYGIGSAATVAVNTYTGSVTASAATGGTFNNANYIISYNAGNIIVGKASLTITVDAKAKIYGDTDPPLTYTIGNGALVGTDVFSGSLSRDAGENTGSYAIRQGSLLLNNNYTITYIGANLVINQRVLTITPDAKSKIYGQVNPPLTLSYSGFINNDNASGMSSLPIIATTATTSSPAGNYLITASGAVMPNYTIVYVPGTFIITLAPLTITADNKFKQYGTVNPALTVNYSGFVNGDNAGNLITQPTISTLANSNSNPGTYDINVNGAAAANYTINYVKGLLTIMPLTIADITSLTISSGIFSPALATGTHNYNVSINNATSFITLVPAYDITASATINGTAVPNGSPSYNIPINVGNNTITIVVTAQDGTTKNTYTITVYRGEPIEDVIATNILTPNGDGKNDYWEIKDIGLYPQNMVTVYDKGGRVVYSKRGYNNDWNGTLNGAPLTEGTYYYLIDLGARRIKGFITILRNR